MKSKRQMRDQYLGGHGRGLGFLLEALGSRGRTDPGLCSE